MLVRIGFPVGGKLTAAGLNIDSPADANGAGDAGFIQDRLESFSALAGGGLAGVIFWLDSMG